MSALGQKQTCAVQNGMSALHPKADMCGATRYVRFVPKQTFRPVVRIRSLVFSAPKTRPLMPAARSGKEATGLRQECGKRCWKCIIVLVAVLSPLYQ